MSSVLQGGLSGVTDKIGGVGNTIATKGQGMMDAIFPPEKRAELLAKVKSFVLKNPKVSAFLMTNIALTGGPLILFVLFSITVFIFALIVALVVALLAAVAFTLFAVGVALLILFPVVFFTTLAATFLFLWALGGYYILKWFNKGEGNTPRGDAIGDRLNDLTGGKLGFLTDNAREAQKEGYSKSPDQAGREARDQELQNQSEKKQMEKNADEHVKAQSNGTPKKQAHTNGTPSKLDSAKKTADGVKKNVNANGASNAANNAHKQVNGAAGNVTKAANVDGVQNKLGGVTGTAKGTLGGASGLT